MSGRHWTQDEMLQHLYGVGPEQGHLEACPECRLAVDAMASQRRSLAENVTPAFLAQQRRRIWQRVERPSPRWGLQVAAALGGMVIMVGGFLSYRESAQVTAPVTVAANPAPGSPSDEQLLREVSSLLEEETPLAATPIQSLFVE